MISIFPMGIACLSVIFLLETVPFQTSPKLENSVLQVVIPRFGEDGRLLWKLEAAEVKPSGKNRYLAKEPILQAIAGRDQVMEAKSSLGLFDVVEGKAHGNELLKVRGKGFRAHGINWLWQQKTRDGLHRMTFQDEAIVKFSFDPTSADAYISPTYHESTVNETNSAEQNSFPSESKQESLAESDFIEFIALKEGGYRFSLDGNVSIKGEDIEISCSRMQIFLTSDQNESSDQIGKIKEIQAFDSIVLKQPGRICHADTLSFDGQLGNFILYGNAKVVDDQWGTAVGEKIILEKGRRRARILKANEKRPRLSFPAIDDLLYPFSKKK